MPKTVLVAETGADIPRDIAERFGIEIVPMHVCFGDRTLPDGTFPVSDVYDYYKTTGKLPTTSGSTPEDFATAFDRIHRLHPEANILYLAYSAITTCSFQSAQIAAQGRSYVQSIDTKQVSVGQAAVVTRLAQMVDKLPTISMDSLKSAANDLIEHVKMCFVPDGLEYLRAGGRVSNAQYLGAQVLKLHPLIEIHDGKLITTKKYMGKMSKVAEKLTRDFLLAHDFARDSLWFLHSSTIDEDVRQRSEKVAKEHGFKDIVWMSTGCVVSTHSGPGAFGIVGIEQ